MRKKMIAVILFIILFNIPASVYAASLTFSIDSIYDDKNSGDWRNQKPTLKAGETYNITVRGSGNYNGSNSYPPYWVMMGLFIDWTGDIQQSNQWQSLGTEHLVICDDILGTGSQWYKTYTLSYPVTIPISVPDMDTVAFAGLTPYFNHYTNGWAPASHYYTYGTPNSSGYTTNGDMEFPVVHLEPSAVPEPSTMFLLSLGILGGIGRRLLRKSK